jgi:hypothetical protein
MKIIKIFDILFLWFFVLLLSTAALYPLLFDDNIFIPSSGLEQFSHEPFAPFMAFFCILVTTWLSSKYVNKISLKVAWISLGILFFVSAFFISILFAVVVSLMAGFAMRRLKNEFSDNPDVTHVKT